MYADKKRREVNFKVGDSAYLKIQPYRLRSLARRHNEKLSPRFYGPFVIKNKIGAAAYQLDLPLSARIHNVFHVSQLKKAIFPIPNSQPLPNNLNENLVLNVEPQSVLKKRKLLNEQWEVLIHWKGLPEFESTWEDFHTLNTQFPSFHLEDKVALLGEGNDRSHVMQVYNRQRKHSRGSQAGLAKQYRTDGNRTEDNQHKTDGEMGEEQYNILLLE
ncbi:uncharacterized protein LOC116129673 [Pistacia vera]|uniref:uncharacterized protein LOC116129673 n=1 Tax=Pistacia vera TaxID=55513 RepID=UPI0012635E8D|nr:uncharacterized protein LOC116129673 [Pistacia vera]